MVDYREILRLQSLGHNITQIAGSLHNSRNTVREVERLADEKGIRWPLEEEVTNPQLYVLLYPERQEKANVYLEPDCAWIHRELAKKGVNLTLLWKEYQVNCSNAGRVPYQYTQFCDIYRAWAKKSKATMRIHHKPGDAMEVDWAGGTLPIKDPVTGETVPAYLFVGVLPCSCYVYTSFMKGNTTRSARQTGMRTVGQNGTTHPPLTIHGWEVVPDVPCVLWAFFQSF